MVGFRRSGLRGFSKFLFTKSRFVFCSPLLTAEVLFVRGRGAPIYQSYRYVPPQWVWFSRLFGLKTDMHFAYFGVESGMVFEGS